MSKYIKFFALAGAALLLGACQEDLGLETGTITPGNEILFGANAYFENGEPQTRTEYGDIVGNQIEVLWVPGEDRVDIACPQAVGAPGHQAEYMVSELENDTTSGWNGDGVAGNDRASVLVRRSAVGLQWSTSRTHNFYAAYPSKNQIAERAVGKLAQGDIEKLGMTVSYNQETNEETATLSGFIPVDQSPADENITGSSASGWVVEPDMTYAYMVANASHTYGAGSSVSLQFQPQVTALEFEIVSSNFETNTSADYPDFTILGAQLFSRSGKQMAGQFTYTFPLAGSGTGEFKTIAANGYEKITQTFGDGLLVAEGQSVKCTFFMLPGVAFNGTEDSEADLGLTVIYRVGNSPQAKTATLKKEITPKKKYFFSNVKLPTIEENVSGSTWFSALAPQTLFSQVSIPVASNMFANPKYAKTNVNYFTTQQITYLKEMWNMGVRGFELCNQSSTDATEDKNKSTEVIQGKNLDDEGMVASETVLDFTFRQAIDTLYNCYKGSKEPLILVCTYAAVNDGYNPYHYVANLFNSLSSFCTRNSVDPSTFVQITSSTTAEDLMGKIAVIIRPGDDERWAYMTDVHNSNNWYGSAEGITTDPYRMLGGVTITGTTDSPYGLTKTIQSATKCIEKTGSWENWSYKESDVDKTASLYGNAWWSRVLMISDWGMSSWDSWHRRGGDYYKYATTATNFDKVSSDRRKSIQKYEQLMLDGTAPSLTGYYYRHDMSNNATAFVQDMTRVIKTDTTVTLNKKTYTWLESLSEKKAAIDGLFQQSVNTKGNVDSKDIYINVLSSYYGTKSHNVSLYPCYDDQGFKNSGKGGDYKSAAKDLTTYVYGILSGENDLSSATGTNKKLAQGPWGLVMMDYIGDASNADSRKLIDLIMLNNFRFPLAMKTTVQSTNPDGGGTPGEGDENQPGQGGESQGGNAD